MTRTGRLGISALFVMALVGLVSALAYSDTLLAATQAVLLLVALAGLMLMWRRREGRGVASPDDADT